VAVQSKVRNLVELIVVSEGMRAKALCGRRTDIAALIKVENRINRLQRDLAFRPTSSVPSLKDYLAAKAHAEAAGSSADAVLQSDTAEAEKRASDVGSAKARPA
jgi:hypothetical protein